MLSSESNRAWARARDNSVLPTPVGPRKMNEPIGRREVLDSARARSTASATRRTASSWPITRSCRDLVEAEQLLTLTLEQPGPPGPGPPGDDLGDLVLGDLLA